ncbi:hypothetical protein ACFQGW_08045 [Xanthomonas theicola]|uniref:hypothetical protein n=1 Tax=Xanthomonas theicola TaxID=56464 RepID=UPI003618F848
MSGLGSGFIEQILLSAIDRRARLANMPAFKPVPPTVLSPAPGPVQMEITPQGRKHFWRPLRDHQVSHVGANGDHPTLDALQGVAHDRQRQLLQRQKLMEGKAEATFLRPLLTGTFNGIRRRLSSVSTLLSPTKLLGTSMLSAGGAGALTRAILETGKALSRTGQTQIDNLVGGRQTVNLFRLARLDESTDALRWSDARRLPDTLLDIAREAGALAAQPLTSPRMAMQVARDLLLRHIGGNIFTGWVATGEARSWHRWSEAATARLPAAKRRPRPAASYSNTVNPSPTTRSGTRSKAPLAIPDRIWPPTWTGAATTSRRAYGRRPWPCRTACDCRSRPCASPPMARRTPACRTPSARWRDRWSRVQA